MTSVAPNDPLSAQGPQPQSAEEAGSERPVLTAIAAGQAVAYGLSPLFNAYYDFATWGVICLATLAVVGVLILTVPVRLARPAVAALACLVGLAVWSAVSVLWAESEDSAWTEANRLAFYAASFGVSVWCIRTVRSARTVVAALAVALAVVVVVVTVRLFSPPSEFDAFRLVEPLGYVNGMAGSLMMAVWVFLGLIHWPRLPSLLSGGAVALATLSGCLLVLTQSRAVVPAIAASALVLFLFAPQRVPRAWALIFVCGATAAAVPTLIDVYQQVDQVGGRATPTEDVVQRAALAAIVVSLAAGALWAVATAIRSRVTSESLRVSAVVLAAAIPIAAAVVGLALVGDPVERTKRGYDDFTSPRVVVPTNNRYASLTTTTRYDFWRVAWDAFRDHPARGLGAGNFAVVFPARRRTPEYVRNPHSVEVQVLSELGVVGGVLLLGFVGAASWSVVRRRAPTLAGADLTVLVVGAGVFSVWLVHTSIDWLHNLPGVTGMALLGLALLVVRPQPTVARPASSGTPYRRWLPLVAAVSLLALAAGSIGRALAADAYLRQAKGHLPGRPDLALRDARRSLDLNPEAMSAYYASAAASAGLGSYDGARDALLEATRREPSNYVPWGLLGDLETRRGNTAGARAAYAKASMLSPFDPDLRSLTRQPTDSGSS